MTDIQQAVETWKKAYRVLDVPETASVLAIKSNYRKLIKRWHPDKPTTRAATAPEAMMMTKLINDAYAQIQNAPLRYYAGGDASHGAGKHSRARVMSTAESPSEEEVVLIEKRVEYAARIICGLLSGAFVGLIFAEELFLNNVGFATTALICAIGFAAGAVKLGDKIWREIFGLWWKWQ